jgi:glycosyltransferase involved in cell wall biosynthesis
MVDGIGTYGGAESLAREITMRLDPLRFRRTFCVTRWEALDQYRPALDELERAGVGFIGLERNSRVAAAPWRRLVAFAREERVGVMHTHKLGSNFWGAMLRGRTRVPALVAQEHGISAESTRLRRVIQGRLIAPRVDAFVAVCEADRRLLEVEGVPAAVTRVIRNGIPTAPDTGPPCVRRELCIPEDALVVGAVATLRPEKALDVLIEAAARLRGRFPSLRVLIAGGPDATQPDVGPGLARLAADLGLDGTVSFLGLRDDVDRLVREFDVAVLCSDREAGPLSLLEYMESARPLVATRVGGIPEIVEDGHTGVLVEPRDPAALAEAIAGLLADPARARRLGDAGRELRRREFDIDLTVRRFEELYSELSGAAGGPR